MIPIHAMVDDHSRLAYAEVLPDEKGATCAGFLTRAGTAFAAAGIPGIDRVLTDNARNYRNCRVFAQAVAELGAYQKFIRPHCPWTNCEGVITSVPGVGRLGLTSEKAHHREQPHRQASTAVTSARRCLRAPPN